MQNPNKILSVRALVRNTTGYIAMGQRAGGELAGCWELLGGKVDKGESSLSAGLREPFEEAGIVIYPTSRVVQIEQRVIPDGKHAGKLYTALGLTAIALPPFDVLEPREDTKAAEWMNMARIASLEQVTPTTRAVLSRLL
jgi:8-oxo-dGTP pyrophosphatase MutT (NUDIX family)